MSQWFSISGQDNDSNMCGSADRILDELLDVPTCRECGFKLEPYYINPAFRVTRRKYDFSFTYDNYCIVSEKFRKECAHSALTGAGFLDLPADPSFFVFVPTSVVKFDVLRRETRFEKQCKLCGHYGAIAGAFPASLTAVPNSDFARTDVLFGSGNERQPIIIASERAKKCLVLAKLTKGMIFDAATT
jgi:hypothetical protein